RLARHSPPAQLLRAVFEDCNSFAEARRRLETTPIARPVIYTLAGIGPAEQCVIDRPERGSSPRPPAPCGANDGLESLGGGEGGVGADVVMPCSREEAGAASR